MNHAPRLFALSIFALFATSCGQSDTDSGPGGVTVAEARALDEAAEMIEQRRLPEEALKGTENAPNASEEPQGAVEPTR